MATRYYGTSTAYAVAHAAAEAELELSSSAPGSGSHTESVAKAKTESVLWTGPTAGTGYTTYQNSASQSLDISAINAAISIATGALAEDAQTVIVVDGGVSDIDAVQMGAWSSTTCRFPWYVSTT